MHPAVLLIRGGLSIVEFSLTRRLQAALRVVKIEDGDANIAKLLEWRKRAPATRTKPIPTRGQGLPLLLASVHCSEMITIQGAASAEAVERYRRELTLAPVH
jgi:hypothetical protein